MRAFHKIKSFIDQNPLSPTAQTLADLVASLQNESNFPIKDLYQLDSANFELAMALLREWQIDRYDLGNAKTFDAGAPTRQQTTDSH